MEAKMGHVKKQNRKHAQNDPPAPSPVSDDVPPPPSPEGNYSTNGFAEDSTSNNSNGDREWKRAKKGHEKKERTKKNKHTKNGHGRKGGDPGAQDKKVAKPLKNAEMKLKKAQHGKKKKKSMNPSEVSDGEADDSRGWTVDATETNKKGGQKQKHKNKKKEKGATKMKHLPQEEEEAHPAGESTPQSEVENLQVTDAPTQSEVENLQVTDAPTQSEVENLQVTDAPTQSEVKNLQVTDAPTPAPVTDKPATQEPTLLAPVVPVVAIQSEGPTVPTAAVPEVALPACPPAWDTSKTTYEAGEYIEVQSHIFQCHALYVEYCNIAEWDESLLETNPNAKFMWDDAWTHIEPCTITAARGDSPAPSVVTAMVFPAPVTDEPTLAPVTPEPTTNEPTTNEPTTEEPTSKEPTTEEPTTADPTIPLFISTPTTPAPPTNEPSTEIPTYMPTEYEVLPACPPPYDTTKTTYVAGELAEVQSHIFECLYEEYCNVADWDENLLETNPDAKEMWNDAWTHTGPCTTEDAMGAVSAGVAVSVDSDASD